MKYSVITINYNNAEGLDHTIESVISQSFADFEFIVIDGGSTDHSIDVIRKSEDKIDYWVSEKDAGIYNAMNKGTNCAHGEYCIFMNSGDSFYNRTVLETINNCNSDADIIVGKVSIDNHDNIISPPPLSGRLTFFHLYSGGIPHQGAFIRTSLLHKHPYDENLRIASDWKFFIQSLIFDNCTISFLDEYVARYNLEGVSSSNPELMKSEKDMILSTMFPIRVLEDYKAIKESECLTVNLALDLKKHYGVDRLLYKLGKLLLKFVS